MLAAHAARAIRASSACADFFAHIGERVAALNPANLGNFVGALLVANHATCDAYAAFTSAWQGTRTLFVLHGEDLLYVRTLDDVIHMLKDCCTCLENALGPQTESTDDCAWRTYLATHAIVCIGELHEALAYIADQDLE